MFSLGFLRKKFLKSSGNYTANRMPFCACDFVSLVSSSQEKGNHWCGVTLLKDVQSCHLLFQKTEKKESKLPILRNTSLSFHFVLLHRDFFPVKRRTWISRVSTLSPQIITPRAGRGHAESGPFYHLSRVKAVLLPSWGRAGRGEENT